MISTIQTYQLNNKQVEVDLTRVPEFSSASKNILTSLFKTASLPSLRTPQDGLLINEIKTMENTMEMLQQTKENGTFQKARALLKTAFVVAMVAVLILCCLSGGPLGFPIGMLIASVLFSSCSLEMISDIEKTSPEYLNSSFYRHRILYALFSLTGLMPLCEAYTREARLTRVLNEQQNSISNTLSQYKDHNEQVLPLAYRFYRDQTTEAMNELNHRIERIKETNLSDMPAECLDLKESRLHEFYHARHELACVAEFYKQFDPEPVQV